MQTATLKAEIYSCLKLPNRRAKGRDYRRRPGEYRRHIIFAIKGTRRHCFRHDAEDGRHAPLRHTAIQTAEKEVLDKELALVEKLGVEFRNNIKIGRDISDTLNQEYDAVIAAPGAWSSTKMRGIDGEDAEGVFGGIDFPAFRDTWLTC